MYLILYGLHTILQKKNEIPSHNQKRRHHSRRRASGITIVNEKNIGTFSFPHQKENDVYQICAHTCTYQTEYGFLKVIHDHG